MWRLPLGATGRTRPAPLRNSRNTGGVPPVPPYATLVEYHRRCFACIGVGIGPNCRVGQVFAGPPFRRGSQMVGLRRLGPPYEKHAISEPTPAKHVRTTLRHTGGVPPVPPGTANWTWRVALGATGRIPDQCLSGSHGTLVEYHQCHPSQSIENGSKNPSRSLTRRDIRGCSASCRHSTIHADSRPSPQRSILIVTILH